MLFRSVSQSRYSGLDGAPTAGDKFKVYEDEREAKSIANKREQLQREQTIRTKKHLTLDELGRRIALGDYVVAGKNHGKKRFN